MKKKIRVDFQEKKNQNELAKEQQKVDALNQCLELSKEISGNEITTYKVDELNKYLSTKSGFPNPEYSSKLLGLNDAYKSYLKAYNEIKGIDDKIIKSRFKSTVNGFILSDVFIKELEESNTIYLAEELVPVYEKLNEVVQILNEVEETKKTASNYLKRDYQGVWSVAISRLHQINVNF